MGSLISCIKKWYWRRHSNKVHKQLEVANMYAIHTASLYFWDRLGSGS